MATRHHAALATAALLISACGGDAGGAGGSTDDTSVISDGGATDVVEDTAPDTTLDAAPDVVEDTAPDTTPDTAPDVVEDTALDTTLDATPDTAPDATPDTAPDTTPDTAPDATPDTAPDTTPDTAPDATPDTALDTTPDAAPDTGGGDFCVDDSFGHATTPTPTADGAGAFTTVLRDCSLTADEAAICYGAAHTSTTTVAGGQRIVTSNGIPNHDVDLFPNMGNPNVVTPQSLTRTVTTSPTRGATAVATQTIGFALNGIKFEPETAETYSGTQWRYEALTFLGRAPGDTFAGPVMTSLGFDCNFAHVQPTGEYHYHGVPTAVMSDTPGVTQVGWAMDGYPILGRWGYATPGDPGSGVVELTGSYAIRDGARAALAAETPPPGDYDGTFVQDWEYVDGLGDLDECNGRVESVTLDGVTWDYAYYLTYTYPYMPRCLWSGTGGGTGPTPCTVEADCAGACGTEALGCTCTNSPMDGRICVATCTTTADCGPGQVCGGMGGGICVPGGGP